MGSLIPLIIVLVVGGWLIAAYNGLVSLKNQTINAFNGGSLSAQLAGIRRATAIPLSVASHRTTADRAAQQACQ